jgi:hypothetical protein
LTQDELTALQYLLDSRLGPLFDHVLFVELHVTSVQDGVLWRGDVDERSLHTGQYVLYFAEVDVAVNLIDVVGRSTDVVLNQTATFQHCHLGEIVAHVHAHEIAPEWSTVSLFAAPPRNEFGIDFLSRALMPAS